MKKDKEEKAAKEDGGSVTENYTFVFIIDDWGYSKGGINVFNKLLCEAMSRLAHSKVVCVVQNVSADKERQTTENGIEILYISKENNNEKLLKKFHQTTLLTYSFHFTNKPFLKVSKHAVSKIQFLRKKTFFFWYIYS